MKKPSGPTTLSANRPETAVSKDQTSNVMRLPLDITTACIPHKVKDMPELHPANALRPR